MDTKKTGAFKMEGDVEKDLGANSLELSKFYAMDAEKIGTGAYHPVDGFMDENDIMSVLASNQLQNGKVWAMPIFLPTEANTTPNPGDQILLKYDGETFARMDVESSFSPDLRDIAKRIYLTDDLNHPGVRHVLSTKGKLISGKVTLLRRLKSLGGDPAPAEVREQFRIHGWRTIAAYQTRNPPHLAHEYIQRIALEIMDGLFINPVVGELKQDDFNENVIMDSYNYFVNSYYPHDRVLLAPLHIAMRYAGPRAAAFFASIRKNYGCTHFLIGRDMAGIGSYYEPFAAQKFVSSLDLGIQIIVFDDIYYCEKCAGMVSIRNCRHGRDGSNGVSMSSIRDMIRNGLQPPRNIMRPDVAELLIARTESQRVGE